MSAKATDSTSVVLPPRLFGSVGYYATLCRFPKAYIDYGMRYDKRDKAVHRYEIADTRGRLSLTVPVSRPSGATRWSEITVSPHGRWWEVHFTALESAYGRTPFFEYYADRFRPLFVEPTGETVADFCRRADEIVLNTLCPDTIVCAAEPGMGNLQTFPPNEMGRLQIFPPIIEPTQAYWQVRADKLGFISGLSILDLLFNLGPDAMGQLSRAKVEVLKV